MNTATILSIGGLTLTVISIALSRVVSRRLRVLVHRAGFVGIEGESYFIDVTNVSLNREVEITHVWFETPSKLYFQNPLRPLPKRLKVDEPWATWVPVETLDGITESDVYKLARVRTSNGKVFKSKFNKSVPAYGPIPGGSQPEVTTRTGTGTTVTGIALGTFAGTNENEPGTTNLRDESEMMQNIVDDLRRSTREHKGNCLTAEIGSEKDRLYGRMAERGLLVRGPFGYTLPEYGGFNGGRSSRFRSRFD